MLRFRLRTLIPRFTTRDLLWLTVVAALGMALHVHRMETQKELGILRQQVEAEKESLQKKNAIAHKQSLDLVNMLQAAEARQFRMHREIEERARTLALKYASELQSAKRTSSKSSTPQPAPQPVGDGEKSN